MKIKNIVIYRVGLLGDTLVGLPVLNCLRWAYPQARITYIWQKIAGKNYVSAREVLDGAGLVDEFLCDELSPVVLSRCFSLVKIWKILFFEKVDLGIVLEEPHWPSRRKTFLRFCGVRKVIGPDMTSPQIVKDKNGDIERSKHISDALIDVLRPLGIDLPGEISGDPRLWTGKDEKETVDMWVNKAGIDPLRNVCVGVSPWSNMPLKRWPLENYLKVLGELIKDFKIVPIFFGGGEEREITEKLIKDLGCGYTVAGELSVREGVELLSRFKMYLGNDTGTMHMAVAAGIRCVAIFSSRDAPGRWEPYGMGHTIFRTKVDCEGCMLRECLEEDMKCLLSIKPEEVIDACRNILIKSDERNFNLHFSRGPSL